MSITLFYLAGCALVYDEQQKPLAEISIFTKAARGNLYNEQLLDVVDVFSNNYISKKHFVSEILMFSLNQFWVKKFVVSEQMLVPKKIQVQKKILFEK